MYKCIKLLDFILVIIISPISRIVENVNNAKQALISWIFLYRERQAFHGLMLSWYSCGKKDGSIT